MILNPYAAGAKIKMLHNDKFEDSTHNNPTLQSQGTDCRTNKSDSKPDCDTKSNAPQTMIRRSSQHSTIGVTMTRSRQISGRPELTHSKQEHNMPGKTNFYVSTFSLVGSIPTSAKESVGGR